MRRMVGARDGWAGISKQFRLIQKKPICTNNKSTTTSNGSTDKVEGSLSTYKEAYRQLDKLDFMTAAKILFNSPPKEKKFGIDFHLVQLFFACMPSLAVYLVAQYARYEMRRMEAEMELKKQAEEEAKAKENELNASEETEAGSDPELSEVKARLDKLEEAVKEIVVESKKKPDKTSNKNQEDSSEKRGDTASVHNHPQSGSEASNSSAKDHHRSVHNHPQSRSEASNSTAKGHHSK